jgi:hypothetical protein
VTVAGGPTLTAVERVLRTDCDPATGDPTCVLSFPDYVIGRPALRDFDGDGRTDVAFSENLELLAIFPRDGGFDVRFLPQFPLHDAIFADVTGDGAPDLIAEATTLASPSAAGFDLLVLASVERRSEAASRFGSEGGSIASTRAPIAGALLTVPPLARAVTRSATVLEAEPLDLPPVTASAVFAATVYAPASPAVSILPETEALSAAAMLTIPLTGTAIAALDDVALAQALRVFRREPEALGGRGATVPVPAQVAVSRDRGRRLAQFAIDRFGQYQLAVER